MSKIRIEDLPSLEELDPEDQRRIRNGNMPRGRNPRGAIPPAPSSPPPDDDIIVSRIPPES
jgi:hypothetical protein